MNGVQTPLPVTDPRALEQAVAAWQKLLASAPPAGPVSQRVVEYLKRCENRVKPHTLTVYRWYLGQFVESFGGRVVESLTAENLEDDARRSGWSSSTRNTYLGTVLAFLNWCGVRLRVKKPPKQSAGARSVIPEETYRCLLTHCQRGDWHALLVFLWHTGARPSEGARLTAEQVDWTQKVVRIVQHKTDATGQDRLVFLSPEAVVALEGQRAKYGSGLLFRSAVGGVISRQAFVRKFARLSRRVGRRVNCYGLRHSYITRALASGESDTIVAALVGHASTAMIHFAYKHVSAMGRQLRDAAERIGRRPG